MMMTESQYNVVEVAYKSTAFREPSLLVHMVCVKNLLDTPISIMPLYGSELKLDGGRFLRYSRTLANNGVSVGKIRFDIVSMAFTRAVEWIAENTVSTWNFHLAYTETDAALQMTFYFDDPTDAVIFRLSIQSREI